MKKFLTIAVAFIYLAISSGLILEIHYCMGKEAGSSVKFAGNATPRCGKCGMENGPHKCCHNELKLIKVQDSHQQVSLDYQCQAPEAPVQEYNVPDLLFHFNASASTFADHSPPSSPPRSLCILNCVFRI
jgi:hypothetical protein